MPSPYLNLLAELGIDFAHPGGLPASLSMLSYLPSGETFSNKATSNGRATDRFMPRLLEIGCGTGAVTPYLVQKGYEVNCIERDARMVTRAKQRFSNLKLTIELLEADIETITFPDATFHVIWMESVMSFLSDRLLTRILDWLHPQGMVLNREMMRGDVPLPRTLEQELLVFYGLQKLYTPQEWQMRYSEAGFEEVVIFEELPLNAWLDPPQNEVHPAPGETNATHTLHTEPFSPVSPEEHLLTRPVRTLSTDMRDALVKHNRLTWAALPYLSTAVIRAYKQKQDL
ncbi:MAG: putative methyltransferase YodH [Candidatus Carbobacillus altaicus]|uniref:Putative methyltransferase YodH n=1 Tax=Candidatus Carbonibacillus altaicus TaxID=2163959 RepID=A0A2R6XYN8_9BACL|nr:MAG: putative methyltransferase YodH [Candidatus Carbobacillus altaicus]